MSFYKVTFEPSPDFDKWFDGFTLLGAFLEGRRYWVDHKGQFRRVPGKKSILSHGRKSR